MAKKISVTDFSIRLCGVIANSAYNWRYFHAMLDMPDRVEDEVYLRFRRFLIATKQAHCIAAIVGLYTALDGEKPDYLTLKNFAEKISKLGYGVLASDIDAFFSEHSGTIHSIAMLRHQWAAHRTTKSDEKESFKRAEVSPERVGDLVEALVLLHPRIAAVSGRKLSMPADDAHEVRNLVEAACAYYSDG